MVKKITFLRRILCICKCFIEVQFILVSMLKKKITKCAPIGDDVHDFVLNFAVCSAYFYLCINGFTVYLASSANCF